MPTNYSSLLIVLATCTVFLYGLIRVHAALRQQGEIGHGRNQREFRIMLARVALLVIVYVLIGAIAGFSILLCIGLLSAIYGLVYPSIDTLLATDQGEKQSVS